MATTGQDGGGTVYIRPVVSAEGVAAGVADIKQEFASIPVAADQAAKSTNKSLATLGVPADATANIERFKDAFGGIARATKEELGESARFTNSYVSQLRRTAADVDSVTQAMVNKARTLQSADPRLQNDTVNQTIAGLQKLATQNEAVTAAVKQQAAAQGVANKTAQEAAAAFANFERSAQSARLELLSFGKAASEKYQIRAELLGIDKTQAVQKIVSDLKAAEAAALAAGKGVGSGLQQPLERLGMTAKQTTAALRQVPAQFTDIIVSLQGGQAPLTVLLQQGGQLKDVFGGVGAATKALGGYVLGLVNPLSVTAAAIGTVGYAAYSASEDVKALRNAIALAGVQGTTSFSNLNAAAAGLSNLGVSSSAASAALATFIGAGAKVDSTLQDATKAAIDLEKLGGPAVEETAKKFVALAKDPLADFDRLTLATYKQIEALLEQGNKTDAVKLAQEAFTEANRDTAKSLATNLGPLDVATKAWGRYAASVWDAAKAASTAVITSVAGTPMTGDQERAKLQGERDWRFKNGYDTTEQDKRLAYFKAVDAAQQQTIANATKEIKLKELLANFDKNDEGTKRLRDRNKLIADNKELLEAGLISQKKYDDSLAAFDKKGPKEKAAPKESITDAQRSLASYLSDVQKRIDKEEELTEVQRAQNLLASLGTLGQIAQVRELVLGRAELLDTQVSEAAAAKESAKALEEKTKALDKWYDLRAKDSQDLDSQIAKRTKEVDAIGQTAEAVAELSAAKYDEAAANKEAYAAALQNASAYAGEFKDAYLNAAQDARDQAAKLRELSRLSTLEGTKKASVESAKEAAKAWQKGWEETDRLARDVFVTWAADGSNAAKKIGDTLKKALLSAIYEATIKPVALQVYASVVGGGASGADGAGSALGSLGNRAGMAGYFGSGGLMGAMMGGAGWMTGATTFGGSMAAAGSLMGTGTLAGGLAGAGMAAGAILPPVLIAAAVAEIAKGLDGGHEYTTGSGIKGQFSSSGFVGSNYQSWKNDGDKVFGFSVGHSSSGTNYSAMDAKQAKSLGDAYTAINNRTAEFATALGQQAEPIKRFTKDITLSLGSDVAANQKAIADMFQGIADDAARAVIGTQYSKEGESTAATLERLAASLSVVNSGFRDMGNELAAVSAGSAQVASQLVDAFGGLDKYRQSVSSYLQNFYSQSERDAATRANISTSLASAGYTGALPTDRAAYRALVDEAAKLQNIDTEAGRKLYSTLVGLSDAFASVSQSADATAAALAKEAQAKSTWQQKLDVLTGKTTERQIALQNDLASVSDATTKTLVEQVYAAQAMADAAQAAVDALASANDALDAARQGVATAYNAIQSAAESAAQAVANAQANITTGYLAAQDSVAKAQADIASLADQSAKALGGFASSIGDFLTQIATTDLGANSKTQQLAALKADFAISAAQAKAGDVGALGAITGKASALLSAGKQQSATALDFARLSASVSNTLGGIADAVKPAGGSASADPMVKAQQDLLKAQADLAKWTSAAAESGASTARATTDYLTEWRRASAINASAQADLLTAQRATAGIGLDALPTAIDSLRTAIDTFNSSLSTQLSAMSQVLATMTITGTGGAVAGAGTYSGTQAAQAIKDSYKAGATTAEIINSANVNLGVSSSSVAQVAAITGDAGITEYQRRIDAVSKASQTDIDWVVAEATRRAGVNGTTTQAEFVKHLLSIGWNAGMGDKYMGWASGTTNAWATANGFPAFAQGINYLPRDTMALLHEGEAVIPAAYNPYNPNAQQVGNSAELIAEVRALRAACERQQAALDKIEKSTRGTESTLRNVTEDGAAIKTVAA